MGGPIADRELSRGVRFAVAREEDEAAIRRLLRENPMRGKVSVTFEREPDYFRGADLAGGEDKSIVAYEDDRLVCMGRCSHRECWVDGRATRVGYLAELRLDHAARRRFAIVRDGYRFFRELQSDNLHFTSIVSDNDRARRLLESGARGMPTYAFLGELVTMLIAVPRRPRPPNLRVEPATLEHLPALLDVLNEHGRRFQLATVWTKERLLSLGEHGLPLERYFIAMNGGKVLACSALWDQRKFRQTVVHGYGGGLGFAMPLVKVANRILGHPVLPPPGTALEQAFLSPMAFTDGAEALLPELVEALFPVAAALRVKWLTLALPDGDARLSALRTRFSTRAWPSRLYCVSWPGQPAFKLSRADARFLPDVSLL